LITGSLLFCCSCVVAAESKAAAAAAAATVRREIALETGFYQTSCPELQDIVSSVVASHVRKDPTSGAPLVRLFFHDCAVNVSQQISLSRRPLNIQILFCSSCHS
jgi:peroxidase